MTTDTTTLDAVLRRLNRLERQNRALRYLFLLIFLIIAGVVLMGQSQTNETMQAQRFILTDADGNTRAMLSTNEQGGANLVLVDANGKQRVNLGMTLSETLLSMLDSDAKVRTMLGTDNAHGTFLSINNANGRRRAELAVDNKKAAGLSFFGPGEKSSTSLGEDASGSALVLSRPDLTEGIVLSARQQDASVSLIEPSGVMAALGNAQPPGPGEINRYAAASLVLFDKKGQVLWRVP